MIKSKTIRVTGIISVIITLIAMLNSCYYRELQYSFERSGGAVIAGSSCYYLGQVKEFRRPKGISRFPDGGQIKEIRKIFGFFLTDTISNTTIIAAKLPPVRGWPSWFKTRLEKNETDIVIGIANIITHDSVNGIYLYNIKSGKLTKYSEDGVLPAISETTTLLSYCIDSTLYIEDYSGRSLVSKYYLDVDPVFVTWVGDAAILLFCHDPFRVMELDLNTGIVVDSDMEYIRNYDQELNATEIRKIVEKSTPDLKEILDQTIAE